MEEEAMELIAKIESFYTSVEGLGDKFDPQLANDFLETMEELEITGDGFNHYLDPKGDSSTFVRIHIDFMILYFVTDNWHNPAKFFWNRIPKQLKAEKPIKKIWEIGKLLYTSKYHEAAALITQHKDSPLSDFLRSGYRFIMHKFINQAYDNIDDDTYSLFMGFTKSKDAKAYKKYYKEEVQPSRKSIPNTNLFIVETEEEENVEISSEHLNTLKKLAQFIEKEGTTQLDREA